MNNDVIAVVLVVIASIIGAFAPLMLKLGVRDIKISMITLIFNFRIISGIILYVLSSFFFVLALKHGELTILYPLVSLGYIWVTLISRFILKETINKFKVVGIIFIFLGIIVIGMGSKL